MSILVLPDSLAGLCGLAREHEVSGATVRECLLCAAPELRRRLLDDSGSLRRHWTIFVNEVDLRALGGLDARLEEGDVVHVLPPIAGGLGPMASTLALAGPMPAWLPEALADAEQRYPIEACGLVVEGPSGTSVVRAENVAANPSARFELDPAVVLGEVMRPGARIVAIYHSHPEGGVALSLQDREIAALWPGVSWLVIAVEAGRVREWRLG